MLPSQANIKISRFARDDSSLWDGGTVKLLPDRLQFSWSFQVRNRLRGWFSCRARHV